MKYFSYIGCGWCSSAQKLGVTVCEYDSDKGTLTPLQSVDPEVNVGQLLVDKTSNILYYVNEGNVYTDDKFEYAGGEVYCRRIDPTTGLLSEEANCKNTLMCNPCYLQKDTSGRYLLIAHHSSDRVLTKLVKSDQGNWEPVRIPDDAGLELLSLDANGCPEDILDVKTCTEYPHGTTRFQTCAHGHCVLADPTGSVYAYTDTAMDMIRCFAIDKSSNELVEVGKPFMADKASAPRYLCFHPSAPFLFYNMEITPKIGVLAFDVEKGISELVCTVRTDTSGTPVPDLFPGNASLVLHPNGNILYNVVRAYGIIDVYDFDIETGQLSPKQFVDFGKGWPRDIVITPDAKYVLVPIADEGKILRYTINADGTLCDPEEILAIEGPCVIGFIAFN